MAWLHITVSVAGSWSRGAKVCLPRSARAVADRVVENIVKVLGYWKGSGDEGRQDNLGRVEGRVSWWFCIGLRSPPLNDGVHVVSESFKVLIGWASGDTEIVGFCAAFPGTFASQNLLDRSTKRKTNLTLMYVVLSGWGDYEAA